MVSTSLSTPVVIVPGVNVIELAYVTIPADVFWLARTVVIVGEIGKRGLMMILVTAQPDFTISQMSHGKYVIAPMNNCDG